MGESGTPLLERFSRCIGDWRLTSDIAVAAAALIFYDCSLTSGDELAYLWRWDRSAYVRTLFFLARYPALAFTIVNLLPPTVTRTNVATCLSVITVISSELILVTRTWVIWGKSRPILWFLVIFSFASAVLGIVIVGFDIATTKAFDLVPSVALSGIQPCRVMASAVKHGWVVPYADIIVYEAVVLALTLYRLLKCYTGPKTQRSQLLDVLWIDGVMYFVLMFVLGILNVALVLQVSDPQLRRGGTQLQTVFHSILSTRNVLHITTALKQDIVNSQYTLVQDGHAARVEVADLSDS